MTHQEIKTLIDSVGASYFPHYDGIFQSDISNDKNPRYSLKADITTLPPPAELGNALKVRIYTQNFRFGNNCNAIGIPGRFIFDKIEREKNLSKEVYLLQYTKEGGRKIKNQVAQINCLSCNGFAINPPHHVTVLNLQNLSESEKEDNLRKFVTAYFEAVKLPVTRKLFKI